MKTNSSFGSWLKQRRKALDLTQQDLAHQVGCSVVTIQKIEADKRRPSKQLVDLLADVLAISPDERATFLAFARRAVIDPAGLPIQRRVPTVTHNLPLHITSFVDRESERAQIARRLENPLCRLLTLVGPGGIGKTRLAVEAARARLNDFEQGVYFVPLASISSPEFLAHAIASAIGFDFYGQLPPETQLVNYLRNQNMLLLLDNFEHLLTGVHFVANVLANAPGTKFLITSRERLKLQEEWLLEVSGLPVPEGVGIAEASSYGAVRLFAERVSQIRADFSLESDPASVINICQMVEGMPLGIELVATWQRIMPINRIAEQIRQNLNLLETDLRNMPERHRSLRAVFEHSWKLLSDTERQALMRLSVFQGGFRQQAAEQVAGVSQPVLTGLADKSLMRVVDAERYDLHEFIRHCALEKLIEAGELEEMNQRHLNYFVALAEEIDPKLIGPEQIEWLKYLEYEQDNLRAALTWSQADASRAEANLRLLGALSWFWQFGRANEGWRWCETSLARLGPLPHTAHLARAMYTSAALASFAGDLATSYEQALFCMALCREVGDKRKLSEVLVGTGFMELLRGDVETAFLRYEESAALSRHLDSKWHLSVAVSGLAAIEAIRGDKAAAQAHMREAELYHRADDGGRFTKSLTLFQMGQAALYLDDYQQARQYSEQALTTIRQINDKGLLSMALGGLGAALFHLEDYERAAASYEELQRTWEQLGTQWGVGLALLNLGWAAHFQHDHERALALFQDSLREFQSVWTVQYLAIGLSGVAEVALALGQLEPAAGLFGAAQAIGERLNAFAYLAIWIDTGPSIAAVREQLSEAAFSAAWAEGQAMTLEQAIAYALKSVG
jgi:predicted ATPase/DNA-binding XRE family transcriptional regulator